MKTKELKNKKGITLIALIVTIIIILIISGITIATLTGHNGIINNATNAKKSSEKSSILEQINIAIKSGVSTKTLKINETKFKQALTNTFGTEGQGYTITGDSEKNWIVTVNDISFVVNEDAKIWELVDISTLINSTKTTKTIAVKDLSTQAEIFFLPENFKIASDSATKVDEGIVVEDEEGNQFVWVPVPDVIQKRDENGELIAPSWNDENPKASYTPMATTYTYPDSSVKGTLYRGMLYDFQEVKNANDVVIGAKSTYNENYNVGKTSRREPSLVTSNDNDTYSPMRNISGNDFDSSTDYTKTILEFNGTNFAQDFGKQMQEDYNEMIKSVNTYKGFYVGRYETGYETLNNLRKTTSKPASSTIITAGATSSQGNGWYGLYKMQKEFGTNGKVKSSMVWGSQYDAMMNWMAKTGKTVATATPMEGLARNSSNNYTTGSEAKDILNNIYDLYGCHFEWTLAANSSNIRCIRSGNFNNSKAPSYCGSSSPKFTYPNDGSRLTLHIVE